MKLFLFVVLLVAITAESAPAEQPTNMNQEEIMQMLASFRDNCMQETSANDDDVEQAFHASEATTHEGKCFLKCLYQRTGLVDESGSANFDFIVKNVAPGMKWTPDQIEAIRSNCSKIEASDPCEKAFALETCLNYED